MSRAELLMHGELDLSRTIALHSDFVPAPNLFEGFRPQLFAGVGWKVTKGIEVAPFLGWNFHHQEPIVSLQATLHTERWLGWVDFEANLPGLSPEPSYEGYGYGQVDYRLVEWPRTGIALHGGVETEAWGSFRGLKTWTFGAGPNLLVEWTYHHLRLRLEAAVHLRHWGDEPTTEPAVIIPSAEKFGVVPQFIARFHVVLM